MKKMLLLLLVIFSGSTFAQVDQKKLEGSWQTNCFQYQSNAEQGYAIETYTFSETVSYELKKEIYRDQDCSGVLIKTIEEKGMIKIGTENTNNGFNPSGTMNASYTTVEGKIDLGLIWISPDKSFIKLSRGLSDGIQNTMLGIFQYKKVTE